MHCTIDIRQGRETKKAARNDLMCSVVCAPHTVTLRPLVHSPQHSTVLCHTIHHSCVSRQKSCGHSASRITARMHHVRPLFCCWLACFRRRLSVWTWARSDEISSACARLRCSHCTASSSSSLDGGACDIADSIAYHQEHYN